MNAGKPNEKKATFANPTFAGYEPLDGVGAKKAAPAAAKFEGSDENVPF